MKSLCRTFVVFTLNALLAVAAVAQQESVALRAPSVPLVPVDPYFSIWSPGDKLTDAATVHWTRAAHRLCSLIRIDGKVYRLMGNEPKDLPALGQTELTIMPTTMTYEFRGAGVRASLAFMTPLLPEDLMILSRPVTYLTWQVAAIDGQSHDVAVYFDARAEIAIHDAAKEAVVWEAVKFGDVEALRVGSVEQPVLQMKGDGVRINWGYLYLAAAESQQGTMQIQPAEAARSAWGKRLPAVTAAPVAAKDAPVLSAAFDLGKVGPQAASRWLMLAYDDVYSAQFLHRKMKAYWKKDGAQIGDLLKVSAAEYAVLQQRCGELDKELMADLRTAGNTSSYTELIPLDESHPLCIYDRVPFGWSAIPPESPETNSVWVIRIAPSRR